MTTTNEFARELRRVLYLQKILQYNLEWLSGNMHTKTVPMLMMNIGNQLNSINRFRSDLSNRLTSENREILNIDLRKDQLHDISLLLDTVSDLINVGEVNEIIANNKKVA